MPPARDSSEDTTRFLAGLAAVARMIRGREQLSQAEVARRARVGPKFISAVEHGRANPCVTHLGQLAKGLGLSGIAELLSRADEAASRITALRSTD